MTLRGNRKYFPYVFHTAEKRETHSENSTAKQATIASEYIKPGQSKKREDL